MTFKQDAARQEDTLPKEERFAGIRVSLIPPTGKMKTVLLYGQPEGTVSFGSEKDGVSEFFYIEAMNGKWHVRCNEPAVFRDANGQTYKEAELSDRLLLSALHLNQPFQPLCVWRK